ncbi:MAG: type 1 glutamine amidotransferase [Planctomycetes bacterium]|nr:type 1 glutamine amidotransferase [Planctomycetota bacterium]
MASMKNKRIAILLAQMFDEREFWYPYYRLQEEGVEVVVVAMEGDKGYSSKHGMEEMSEKSFAAARAKDYDGVIIPGGFAPDYLRRAKACLQFVMDLHGAGKLVAFICHAGWVPISCGILAGRRATSVASIKDDMVNAGCHWEDKSVVVDGNLVSSRGPDDLPDFMKAVIGFFPA